MERSCFAFSARLLEYDPVHDPPRMVPSRGLGRFLGTCAYRPGRSPGRRKEGIVKRVSKGPHLRRRATTTTSSKCKCHHHQPNPRGEKYQFLEASSVGLSVLCPLTAKSPSLTHKRLAKPADNKALKARRRCRAWEDGAGPAEGQTNTTGQTEIFSAQTQSSTRARKEAETSIAIGFDKNKKGKKKQETCFFLYMRCLFLCFIISSSSASVSCSDPVKPEHRTLISS
jgi:hypothetical protein